MDRVDYWLTIAALLVAVLAGAFLMVIPCVSAPDPLACARHALGW